MKRKIPIDDRLLEQAISATGAANAETAVEIALRELLQGPRRRDLIELAGKIRFRDDFDHKELRALRRDAG